MYSYWVFVCAIFAFANVFAKVYGIPGNVAAPGVGAAVYGGNAGWYGGGMAGYMGGAKDYGVSAGGYSAQGYTGQEIFAPRPYAFDYQAPDEFGNAHFRQEQGDGTGRVQGSYGYTDNQGLYRQVDYVADAGGFRASVRTNEPGTDGKESPADVNVDAQPPPRGVQEQYTRAPVRGVGGQGKYGGYGTGYGMDQGYSGLGLGYAGLTTGYGGLGYGGMYRNAIGSGAVAGAGYSKLGAAGGGGLFPGASGKPGY